MPAAVSDTVFNTHELFVNANAVVAWIDDSTYTVNYYMVEENVWEIGNDVAKGGEYASIPNQDVEVGDNGWVSVQDEAGVTWRLKFMITQPLTPAYLKQLQRR